MASQILLDLHAKAESNLKLKLGMIKWYVLGKVNIFELYAGISRAPAVNVPPDLGLGFVFEHYDEMKLSNFTMRKDQANHDINRCLFFYHLDRNRHLNFRLDRIRFNLLLMVLHSYSPSSVPISAEASAFCNKFCSAWLESLKGDSFKEQEEFVIMWTRCSVDFIHFKRSQIQRMKKALAKLRTDEIPEDVTIEKFASGAISTDVMRKYGPKLAWQWVLDQKDASNEDIEATGPGSLVGAFAGASVREEEFTMELAKVDWDDPLIRALLKDPDPSIEPQEVPVDENTFWMPSVQAENLVTQKIVDIQQLFENLQI